MVAANKNEMNIHNACNKILCLTLKKKKSTVFIHFANKTVNDIEIQENISLTSSDLIYYDRD